MSEMDSTQKKNAARASRDFERVWQIFTQPHRATLEEVKWMTEFIHQNRENYQGLIQLGTDQALTETLDLVWLGLYHHGHQFPPEFKFKNCRLN